MKNLDNAWKLSDECKSLLSNMLDGIDDKRVMEHLKSIIKIVVDMSDIIAGDDNA